MFVNFKNEFLVGLVVVLAGASFGDVLATPKTWAKGANDCVLVYRAQPRPQFGQSAANFMAGMLSSLGVACLYVAYTKRKQPAARGVEWMAVKIAIGSFIASLTAEKLYDRYYNPLFKPLIIIDKYGITYEGKDKMLWKEVREYKLIGKNYPDYLEISTDIAILKISKCDIEITIAMLHELVDEAYKSYQELEKEKITA